MKKKAHPVPDMNSEALKEFRQAAYELPIKAKNATLELMDAVMTTRNAACLAEFSLSPLFTRQWSSIYEALQDSRPERKKLMILYIKQTGLSRFKRIAISNKRATNSHRWESSCVRVKSKNRSNCAGHDKSGIHVAEYLTVLQPKALLQGKLQEAIRAARQRLPHQSE